MVEDNGFKVAVKTLHQNLYYQRPATAGFLHFWAALRVTAFGNNL
jgi:hypothetical protein